MPEDDRQPHGEIVTTLDRLLPCEGATIARLSGPTAMRTRLRDLGFREGGYVVMIKQAPLADPVEFRILGAHVSLRRSEACRIDVGDVRPIEAAVCHEQDPAAGRRGGWFDRLCGGRWQRRRRASGGQRGRGRRGGEPGCCGGRRRKRGCGQGETDSA